MICAKYEDVAKAKSKKFRESAPPGAETKEGHIRRDRTQPRRLAFDGRRALPY
jgi:hypothetical protein